MTDCKPILREPYAWWAETGTAGSGDGCNRPFWLKHEAVAYVREHGGHVAPLFRSQECDPADPCATAYDLASERNTLDGLWAETKDRLDAALAQVARLREALAAIVARSENGELGTSRTRDMAGLARAALAETADMPAPPPADDGWIAWEDGECPVLERARVEVKFRNGETHMTDRPERLWWKSGASLFDIVAYRIVEARK